MKKYLGVFNLCFNSSFKKVCAVILLGTIFQIGVFTAALFASNNVLGENIYPDSFEVVLGRAKMFWIYKGYLAIFCFAVFGTACCGKSHPMMMLERIGITHEKFFMVQWFYSTGCYLIFAAWEFVALLIMALIYISRMPGADYSIIRVALMRCNLFFIFSTAEFKAGVLWRAVFWLTMGFLAAYYSYVERRGGLTVGALIAAFLLILFQGSLYADDSVFIVGILAMIFMMFVFGVYIIEGVKMEYGKR